MLVAKALYDKALYSAHINTANNSLAETVNEIATSSAEVNAGLAGALGLSIAAATAISVAVATTVAAPRVGNTNTYVVVVGVGVVVATVTTTGSIVVIGVRAIVAGIGASFRRPLA